MTLDDAAFERWLDLAFTRPEQDWTEDEIAFVHRMEPADQVACLERVFVDADEAFALLTDEEINRGLWAVIGSGVDYMRVLLGPPVPWGERERVIETIPSFFSNFMTKRCDEHLSHRDRGTQGGRPLNSICYMWWDCMPTWGSDEGAESAQVHRALLACMERILAIPHVACQESALHGLGHWFGQYPNEVTRIVDGYLARNPDLPEPLKNYALSARCGCVQ